MDYRNPKAEAASRHRIVLLAEQHKRSAAAYKQVQAGAPPPCLPFPLLRMLHL